MAKLKVIQHSSESTLDKPQKSLSSPSAPNSHKPIRLKYAKVSFDFSKPTAVSHVVIPQKPEFDNMKFDQVFFSQLRDGNLVCSYPDGTLALLHNNLPAKPVKYFPLLPPNKTRSIYELNDGFILICLELEGNHQNYCVNLDKGIATKLDLPAVRVCAVLANNDNTVYLGLKDGRLIAWDLKENKLTQAWQITASENSDFEQPNSIPTIMPLTDLHKSYNGGLSTVGIAQSEYNRLLIVLNVKNGYLSCLLDQTTSNLERVQFTPYKDHNKISKKVSHIYFSQSGDFSLVYRNKINSSSLHVLQDRKEKTHYETDKDITTLSTFALANGHLAFAGFKAKEEPLNSVDDNTDETPQVDCILEIQSFG